MSGAGQIAALHRVRQHALDGLEADRSGGHSIAVSAALALLLHWGLVRDRQVGDDDIAAIVDAVLMPCSDGHAYSVTGRRLIRRVRAL